MSLQVEAALASSSYVDNIMVYADPFHNYCVALIVPSHLAIENWAQNNRIAYRDFPDLCQKAEAAHEVQQSLLKVSLAMLYFLNLSLIRCLVVKPFCIGFLIKLGSPVVKKFIKWLYISCNQSCQSYLENFGFDGAQPPILVILGE